MQDLAVKDILNEIKLKWPLVRENILNATFEKLIVKTAKGPQTKWRSIITCMSNTTETASAKRIIIGEPTDSIECCQEYISLASHVIHSNGTDFLCNKLEVIPLGLLIECMSKLFGIYFPDSLARAIVAKCSELEPKIFTRYLLDLYYYFC
jgi:hypothetical protein